jgi:hypothetical protein
MEQMRDSSDAASRDEPRHDPMAPGQDPERGSRLLARRDDAAGNLHAAGEKQPAQRDDVVQAASDDSFPASDPPSWIDVWL